MPHGKYISKTTYDTAMEKMFAYTSSKYPLTHWKCVLQCCSKYPPFYLPSIKYDHHHSKITPTILFLVYNLITRCTMNGRYPFNEKCETTSYSKSAAKLYTRK